MNTEYRNYIIKPKLDFSGAGYPVNGNWVKSGFIVTDGTVNVMPNAAWFSTVEQAKAGLDIFIEVDCEPYLTDYSVQVFRKLMRARLSEFQYKVPT